jgi:hypothetical protein
MRSDPTLRRWYLRYNRKWFAGELPTSCVLYWNSCEGKLALSWWADGIPHITIDPCIGFSPIIAKQKLLHEMAHIAKPKAHHGKVWQEEMLRLASAGAFTNLW